MLDPNDPVVVQRLSDLDDARPADETLRALLGTLTTKIDLCARLPFFAYQADREGFDDAAAAFREMAVDERRSLSGLLAALKSHLDVRHDRWSEEPTP